MNRRHFLHQSASAIALSAFPFPIQALARSKSSNFTPIRRGVGVFEGRGGTIGWLVREDALVVVDSQFPESAGDCLKGLAERSQRSIDLLINSHHHGDHTAGNPVLGENAGHILAHVNVPVLQRRAAESRGNLDQQKYADVTYEESWEQSIGDEVVSLQYLGPAHTSGDSVIHFQNANVVHMGDLVFNHRHAYIDLGAGAETLNWMSVLQRTYSDYTDDTAFIFGHANPVNGVLGSRDDLLIMRDYLGALREAVAGGIRDGKTADEIAADGLQGFDGHKVEGSASGIAGNLKTVYEEVTQTVE